MLSGDEMSEFEIDWTKDTHTWDAAEAESVPLVHLDDTEEFSNYYTRAMEPNLAKRTKPFPTDRVRRSVCFVTWILVLLIIAMVAVIGMVAWTLNQVVCVLPHTFSWMSLVTLYGFSHTDKFDHMKGTTALLVPKIQLVLLSGMTILSCCFLFFGRCRKFCLKTMRLICFVEIIFFMMGLLVLLILWYEVSGGLRADMSTSMNPKSNESMSLWNSTQVSLKCCGIESYEDWVKDETSVIPPSCHNSRKKDCEVSNKSGCAWWTKGCYKSEMKILNFYGGLEIAWFVLACIVSTGIFFSSKLFLRCSRKLDELDSPINQQFFIRIGDNFMSLNNRAKGETLIRLNEIRLTAKGALSTSIGVRENEISMEVHNYCIFDKINISREFDRIVIGVYTSELARGTAIVTSTLQNNLEQIRVVHIGGIIRVFSSV